MTLTTSDELIEFFNVLADAAARETLPRFRAKTSVNNKLETNFDPVTEGDRQAERVIRELIAKTFPTHGIVGEEYGSENGEAELQWIIDPIDGTRAFISGLPVWGTLIGLYQNGKPIAGLMDQPFTRERYLSIGGCTRLSIGSSEPRNLVTSDTKMLGNATLMTTSPHIFSDADAGAYGALERQVKLFRYGCDCYAYCMVAAGEIDLVVESGLAVYDIAALIPIIEGAGGIVTDWKGGDCSQGGHILAAANPAIHAKAMTALSAD